MRKPLPVKLTIASPRMETSLSILTTIMATTNTDGKLLITLKQVNPEPSKCETKHDVTKHDVTTSTQLPEEKDIGHLPKEKDIFCHALKKNGEPCKNKKHQMFGDFCGVHKNHQKSIPDSPQLTLTSTSIDDPNIEEGVLRIIGSSGITV